MTKDQAASILPLQVESLMPAEPTLDICQLRDRGWTRQMVARFLGFHDGLRPATRGGGGRPAELFAISRVRDAERTVAFSEARQTAFSRSALARRSQEERRASVLRFAGSLELALPPQPLDEVLRSVRDTHPSPYDADRTNGKCRAVRRLLGVLSESSARLDVFQGQPGIRDARTLLLERKLNLITTQYPELADACEFVKAEQKRNNEAPLTL